MVLSLMAGFVSGPRGGLEGFWVFFLLLLEVDAGDCVWYLMLLPDHLLMNTTTIEYTHHQTYSMKTLC